MDKSVSRQYFNDHALEWDTTKRSNAPHQLQAMAARLDFPPHALVIDVGTGTGVFVPYVQVKLGELGLVVCVDFAFKMLDIARMKNSNHSINYVCAEIETVGFSANAFDAAVCYSTFPHFHDKPLALENIHRLLKPGGRIFICHTASREFINNIHLNIPDFKDHLIPPKDAMNALMKEAGYQDIRIEEAPDSYLACGTKS
jgi:ubiquinone/menaquinone biosynthesis C-methylase UbiE